MKKMNGMLLGGVVAGLVTWSTAATAQPLSRADLNAAWTASCSAALNERVRQVRPGVQKVQTLADTLQQWQESDTGMGVRGDGQFLLRNDWVRFEFRCVYNLGSRKVDHLSHSVKAAAGIGGPLKSRASADSFTSKACSGEISKRAGREGSTTSIQIFADSLQEWQETNAERGVSGEGQVRRPNGEWRPFRFECTCNVRTGQVIRSDVQWTN